MAIVISGVNNNDKITASDGTIDLLSGVNYTGIITAPSITASNNITSSNNITAGNLNIGSNIQLGNAGVATATTFVGNLTGNVNATSNLLLQIGGSEKFRVASSGQLGIGGANYGTSGQVLMSGGSGSAPSWSTISPGATINNNADNRIVTGGSGVNLNGEANLTYNGSNLALAGNDNQYITIGASADLTLKADGSNSAIVHNGDGDLIVKTDGSNENIKLQSAGYTHFFTGGGNERLRIFSNGSVGVGDYSSTNLTHAFQALRTSGSTYVSSKNTGGNALFYAEASNGNTAKLELMQAGVGNFTLEVGGTNALMFKDDGTEKLRINSGSVWINGSAMPTSSSGARLQVGAHTFAGGNYAYHTSRLGIQNNGSLTCISNCSTYTDVTYPGYGFIMVQGSSTSDYNTFGICPDSPQTGSDLNFHAGYRKSNIHSDSGVRQMWLNFSGQVYKRDNGANWNQTSDERLKKNIVDNNIGLAEIKQLRITSFEYRKADEIDMSLFPKANDPLQVIIEGEEGPHTGVIAQEIESVLPECVKTSDKGAKTVQADAITWALVNAVKELSAKNEALEARVAALEGS